MRTVKSQKDANLGVQVADVGWPYLAGVQRDATLAHAAGLMRELNLGSAGVLAHGSLIGIVTERDVMHAALEGAVLAETPVTRYMTKHPETVSIDTDVSKAALAMIALHVRHLPVRDGSRIVGMISARDLLEPLAGKVAPHAPRMRRARWSRLWPRRPRLDARAEWR